MCWEIFFHRVSVNHGERIHVWRAWLEILNKGGQPF